MLPPRLVRRIIFVPLVFLITVTLITFSPVLFLAALIATPSRSGRRRSLRLLWFGLSWLVMESLALIASLVLFKIAAERCRAYSSAFVRSETRCSISAELRWICSTKRP